MYVPDLSTAEMGIHRHPIRFQGCFAADRSLHINPNKCDRNGVKSVSVNFLLSVKPFLLLRLTMSTTEEVEAPAVEAPPAEVPAIEEPKKAEEKPVREKKLRDLREKKPKSKTKTKIASHPPYFQVLEFV